VFQFQLVKTGFEPRLIFKIGIGIYILKDLYLEPNSWFYLYVQLGSKPGDSLKLKKNPITSSNSNNKN
jgi:hypothetical protein